MRESVNFNMIPIPEDNNNMNGLTYCNNNNVRNILTNVSTNGYYGYQSPLCLNVKEGYAEHDGKQRVQLLQMNNNTIENVEESMDIQYSNDNMASGEARGVLKQQQSRKRAWDEDKCLDFKRRRPNEKVSYTDSKKRLSSAGQTNESQLSEDLLRGIHGCSYYHWIASEV